MCFFFFSSRRRHTIFDCDWSSDVCSSDLAGKAPAAGIGLLGALHDERVLAAHHDRQHRDDRPVGIAPRRTPRVEIGGGGFGGCSITHGPSPHPKPPPQAGEETLPRRRWTPSPASGGGPGWGLRLPAA